MAQGKGSANSQQAQQGTEIKHKMPVLGIDLGGTKLSCAMILDNKIVSEVRKVPTPKGAGKIIEAILKLISDFQKDNLIGGVGIATAGIVNVETGEILGSTGNLPGWEGTPIKTIIEQQTMLPVHVENDANAAAYGETHVANLSKKACVCVVTLGTGIGGGIVVFGKLFRGAHWAAGEVGHIKVAMDNRRLCTCGLFDCWEAFGSGKGFLATSKEILTQVNKEQSELAQLADTVTVELVIENAQSGDIVAQRIVQTWHEHVVSGMVSLAHTLDPDCFLVSGGMSKFVNYDLLRELFVDRTLPRIAEKVEILPAQLGTDAGIIGAARLVVDAIIAG